MTRPATRPATAAAIATRRSARHGSSFTYLSAAAAAALACARDCSRSRTRRSVAETSAWSTLPLSTPAFSLPRLATDFSKCSVSVTTALNSLRRFSFGDVATGWFISSAPVHCDCWRVGEAHRLGGRTSRHEGVVPGHAFSVLPVLDGLAFDLGPGGLHVLAGALHGVASAQEQEAGRDDRGDECFHFGAPWFPVSG